MGTSWCPRCGADLIAPSAFDSAWRCSAHGKTLPLSEFRRLEESTIAHIRNHAEVPLWLPESDGPGTWRVDAARAEAAGLRCRPIAETVADVWAWLQGGGPEAEGEDWLSPHAATGMSAEREREVLTGVAR